MEFQTVGAAKLQALRPTAVVVKGTCSRLCEEENAAELEVGTKTLVHGSPDQRFWSGPVMGHDRPGV